MAYVRKTDILINGIRDKIRNMRRKAEQMYTSSNPEIGTPLYQSMREAVETAAWADAPELRGKLPMAWLRKHDTASVYFVDDNGQRSGQSVYLSSPEHNRFVMPPISDSSYRFEIKVKMEHCNEMLRKWLSSDGEREANRRHVCEQFDNVERQLMAYMDKHASLNSAIKEMPEIEMYIPEEFMRKYHAVEERAAKQKKPSTVDEIGIDTNAIASLAIAHRITTAGI